VITLLVVSSFEWWIFDSHDDHIIAWLSGWGLHNGWSLF